MYMRFVHLRVKPEKMAAFEIFYENRVAPTLHEMKGCLFASLIQSEDHPDECISMTLWNTLEDAQDYEQSRYDALIKENEPYLADSSEWRIQLSDDLTLEFKPVKEPPVVQAFPVATASAGAALKEAEPVQMYLRIVSGTVQPGKFEALKKVYTEETIPALLATDGCRYAYLIGGMQDSLEALSVTLWDSKEQADAYEQSGRYRQVVDKLMPMLSALFQWKMALDSSQQASVATSEDISVEGYHVVTGESF